MVGQWLHHSWRDRSATTHLFKVQAEEVFCPLSSYLARFQPHRRDLPLPVLASLLSEGARSLNELATSWREHHAAAAHRCIV